MNYIFHVRDWNIDFFLKLEVEIAVKYPEYSITWLTMMKSAQIKLSKENKNVFYIPEVCENYIGQEILKEQFIIDFEQFLYDKYNFGIEFLYEIERFKPAIENKDDFIVGHLMALKEVWLPNANLISLSCDHFIYIVSAYINELNGGKNFFVQPVGFPRGAQVIVNDPWEMNFFRDQPLGIDHLREYIDSLSLDPKVSIHYMKPQENISLKKAIGKKMDDIGTIGLKRSIFQYLEPSVPGLLPSRFTKKTQNSIKFDYVNLEEISSLSENLKVIYFPLQFEPEMSILAYSPWFKDQIEIIRLISQSLKLNDILILKENPKMIGTRSNNFYKEISVFGNIRWADPSINSRDIIRSSFKVVSITGTATIEAACMGINSLIFGYPPFRNLLIEKPISDQPLSIFSKILYKEYSSTEIIEHLNNEWPEFSKCVFFGNFTPKYINNIFKIEESEELGQRFVTEIL